MKIRRSVTRSLALLCVAAPAYGQDFAPPEYGFQSVIAGYVGAILVGFAWFGCARFLKRGIRTKGICYWFPTAMLILTAAFLLASDALNHSTLAAQVLDFLAMFTAAPALFAFWLVESTGMSDQIPEVLISPIGVGLFWVSWHLVLRVFRWYVRADSPTSLDLS